MEEKLFLYSPQLPSWVSYTPNLLPNLCEGFLWDVKLNTHLSVMSRLRMRRVVS
jgi:hypothetical protein